MRTVCSGGATHPRARADSTDLRPKAQECRTRNPSSAKSEHPIARPSRAFALVSKLLVIVVWSALWIRISFWFPEHAVLPFPTFLVPVSFFLAFQYILTVREGLFYLGLPTVIFWGALLGALHLRKRCFARPRGSRQGNA